MPTTDPRVDAYIAGAAPFAQPILEHLRRVVHRACPTAEEAIKWSMPGFMYGGRILATMAAFKQHAAFGIWQRDGAEPGAPGADGMGQYGRITCQADLPPDAELERAVRESVARIDAMNTGAVPARKRVAKPALPVPPALRDALDGAPAVRDRFEAMAPGCRREYIEWISEAKREDTRARRIATLLDQVGEGKALHWKYQAR